MVDVPQDGEPQSAKNVMTRDQKKMPRLLVIDHRMVTPDRDAGSLRMWRVLEILRSLGSEVTYATADLSVSGPWAIRLQEMGVKVLRPPFSLSLRRHLRRDGTRYDGVWLCRVAVAQRYVPSIRKYCPGTKVIFDTVDLHFLREQREAELSGDARAKRQAAETRRAELAVIRQVDVTILVSPEEARIVHDECPEANLRILSMIHQPLSEVADFEARRGLLFVGGFEHRPNQDGVEWFVSRILPKIRESLPEEPFWIVGSGATRHMHRVAAPGVTVVGWVLDLTSIYARARVCVAPLRYGAGVKGKITQALAHGLPCVATPVACEGMPLNHEESVLMADDETSFAAEVVRLHQDRDLWQSLSSAGLQIVAEHFSKERARDEVADLLGRFIR